jgi:ribosomal protein S18 acetylase RimI-like enzyme
MINPSDLTLCFNMSDLVIRKVTKADLPSLEWDGEFIKYRRMYANIFHSTFTGNTLMWLIEIPGTETIGQAFVLLKSTEPDAADGATRAYFFAFRIKPHWQNKGIGSYVMQFIEEDLRRRGFKYLTLNVAKDNAGAIRLYERLGYKIIGPRSGLWSYKDHEGHVQRVNEPSWRMIKRIGGSD